MRRQEIHYNMRVRLTTIVGILLIFVIAMNVALASAARFNLRLFSKTHHTGKKSSSKTSTMDDPTTHDDFKATSHTVRLHEKKLPSAPIRAIMTAYSIVVSWNSLRMISIKTSKRSSNNLFDIFIPPKIFL